MRRFSVHCIAGECREHFPDDNRYIARTTVYQVQAGGQHGVDRRRPARADVPGRADACARAGSCSAGSNSHTCPGRSRLTPSAPRHPVTTECVTHTHTREAGADGIPARSRSRTIDRLLGCLLPGACPHLTFGQRNPPPSCGHATGRWATATASACMRHTMPLFSSEKILDFGTIIFSFLFDKHYLVMD